jgi:hypothetical protein
MGMKGLIGAAGLALAASMSAFHYAMPAAKVRPKVHPRHNAKRDRGDWQAFRAKVLATHSFNEDPRDDKYLHSSQRWGRSLRKALAARAA